MQVRFAEANDLPAINACYDSYDGQEIKNLGIQFDRAKTKESIALMLEHGKVSIIEHEGQIIGFIAGAFNNSIISADVYFIGFLFYVHPNFRAFSQRLLQDTKKILKETPATQFILASPGDDEKLPRFYRSLGFTLFEQHFCQRI